MMLKNIYAGLQPKHAVFHPVCGELKDYYAVSVSSHWRLIFQFEDQDALLVDYVDYH